MSLYMLFCNWFNRNDKKGWIPISMGMTERKRRAWGEEVRKGWIPACAGMTEGVMA
ncbi:MAG: hypothetical protein U9O91_02450 [Candidatus Caldatribacteriota bacterium]|nr:hypothetical protein [Candidatus Caldatribacteriota bacterium]